MRADYKDFPDIRFSQNTTNNIVVAGHPGYLLNGTFRDPTSDALQMFTNIGTIIGDKVYSVIYYSPAETYPIYNMKYLQMVKSFEVVPQKSSPENTTAHATNELRTLTITIPPDWGRIDKLTPVTFRSQDWNQGYSAGYFGYSLEGLHTKDYFFGYMNGTQAVWFNGGYADAITGLRVYAHAHRMSFPWEGTSYGKGYDAGNKDRAWQNDTSVTLPAHTNDNYMHYYVGFENGATAADKENNYSTTYYHGGCPTQPTWSPSHTKEYCAGYKAGWNQRDLVVTRTSHNSIRHTE